MQLGDSRTGKLADNIAGFGRALRRAGVRVDSSRIALATRAAMAVGLERKEDVHGGALMHGTGHAQQPPGLQAEGEVAEKQAIALEAGELLDFEHGDGLNHSAPGCAIPRRQARGPGRT